MLNFFKLDVVAVLMAIFLGDVLTPSLLLDIPLARRG
jgi:hypothetical protein